MTWTPPNSDPRSGSQPIPPASGQPYSPYPPAGGHQQHHAYPPGPDQQPPSFPSAPGQPQPPFPPAAGQQPHAAYPPHPGGAAGKRTGPARLSWRLAHSAWLIAPMLPFSCFSAVGFLYVGIRARRPAWWIPGILYTVVANVCFFVGGEAASDSVQQDVAFAIMFLLWPISVAHAFVINASWLRWRAGHVPWYAQPQPVAWPGPSAPAANPLPPQLQGVVPPPQQFYGGPASNPPYPSSGPPASSTAMPPGSVSPGSVSPGSVSPGSVLPSSMSAAAPVPAMSPMPVPDDKLEINSAGEQQLALLPGIGAQRAAQIVAARQARGGFSTLSEFAAVAGLAPHEFVALRDRLSCHPPPPRDGTELPPFGRIVDV